jgi:diaminohydroxyphosphoribosylaminopyrimidine deaminase/5-amino-6-(5-phosphoribosylamino)uracil reductase
METAREAPVIIAYPSSNPPSGLKTCEEKGCELMSVPESGESYQVNIQALLQELGKRDMSNILVEGGSRVLGSFLDIDAIDRVLIFIAPVLIGGEQAVTAVGGKGASSVRHALSFKGKTVIGNDTPEITSEPEAVICQSGKDVLLSGWVHDPRTWHRDE